MDTSLKARNSLDHFPLLEPLPLRSLLHIISHQMSSEFSDMRSLSMPIAADTFFGRELHSLACRLNGESKGVWSHLENEQVLPVFFSDDAADILLRMPNLFWFWRVVHATVDGTDAEHVGRMSAEHVRAGIQSVRQGEGQRFDLAQPMADIADGGNAGARDRRLAKRAVYGIVLVQPGGDEDSPFIDNPLFFEQF